MKYIHIAILLMLFISPAICEDVSNSDTESLNVRLTADNYEFGLDMKSFSAAGNVKIVRGPDILTADVIHGDITSGDILAQGNVIFQSADQSLKGDTFQYNFITGNGIASNSSAKYGPLIFSGEQIKADSGSFSVRKSMFTTCDREKPHYHLSAKEIVIVPGDELIAYGAKINLYGMNLLTVPKYKFDLSNDNESINLIPIILYSGTHGYSASYDFDVSSDSDTDASLEIKYSTKSYTQGGLHIDRLNGMPIFASLTYKEPVTGGIDPEGILSKLPEIGLRYHSDPKKRSKKVDRIPIDIVRDLIGPNTDISEKKKINYIGEFTAGRYIEQIDDTRIADERIDARILAWYDPNKQRSGIELSPALYARYSAYDEGDDYSVLGLKLAVGKKLGKNSYASVGYITNSTSGKSRYQFDTVELRNEIAGAIYFKVSDFNIYLGHRYDASKNETFNTIVSLSRKFHCLEPVITWRSRYKDISFDIKVVGF